MIKTAIISLNLLALIGYKLFFGGEVNVTQSFPEELAAGESFTVEIQIEKGDREGFAKWQQNIPDGFIASAKETEGATFSFKNQEVKLIWMALPKAENFSIRYEIKTDPTVQGPFELEGKFSYIEENERKDVSVEKRMIKIGSGNLAVESNTSAELDTATAEATEPLADNSLEDKSSEPKDVTEIFQEEKSPVVNEEEKVQSNESLVAEEEGIAIYRNLSIDGLTRYKVELKIEKGTLQSFGKVEEYLPPGFIASEDVNSDGMFSFNNKVMKILWMTLPENNTINVSYFIESTNDDQEIVQIHGVFSYLKENESKQLPLKPTTFNNLFRSEEVVEEIEDEEAESMSNEVAETVAETIEANEPMEEIQPPTENLAEEGNNEADLTPTETSIENNSMASNQTNNEEDLVEEITNIPSPETTVVYKVQIAASKTEVKQQYFIDKHSISDQVAIESHNGWFKYTLGGYDVYKKARDRRNEIWAADNKINDAFVTAYNSGERISVQEALMISNQKWFK